VIELPSEQQPVNVIFDKGGWLLKQLDHEKPAEAWLLQLQQGDVADREAALRSLERIIEEQRIHSAVAHVLAHDSFWGVRRQAAETLGWFHDPQVVSLLAPAFRDPEAKVRLAATGSLRDIRSLDVLVALGTLVESDSSFAVVGEAITSLATIDSANGMTYCRKGLSLDSHNNAIRAASAKALATLKSPEAKNLLITLTEYGQPLEVRLAAIEALADTWPRDGRIQQRLEELLQDRIQRVRRKSIEKLGTIASPTSQKALREFLKDEADIILRREVRKALVKIDRAGKNRLYH
jgi:HEAT repeat protein